MKTSYIFIAVFVCLEAALVFALAEGIPIILFCFLQGLLLFFAGMFKVLSEDW